MADYLKMDGGTVMWDFYLCGAQWELNELVPLVGKLYDMRAGPAQIFCHAGFGGGWKFFKVDYGG